MIRLPQNPTIAWLKDTMLQLELNSDRVTADMCFREFFAAYPLYVYQAKKLVEENPGARSLFAYKMYQAGVVDIEWVKGVLLTDTDTHENNLLYIMDKLKESDGDIQEALKELSAKKSSVELAAILNDRLGGF